MRIWSNGKIVNVRSKQASKGFYSKYVVQSARKREIPLNKITNKKQLKKEINK